jgi:putative redox protein
MSSQDPRIRATAHRTAANAFRHDVTVRQHHVTLDEPLDQGGDDDGPGPLELLAASLASCTAITMEMYAQRKGWEIGKIEVEVEFSQAERGAPTRFNLALRFPPGVTEEQRERLQVIATRCPVHRTLEGEVIFEDHVEVLEPAGT